jgi:hypothetical protein
MLKKITVRAIAIYQLLSAGACAVFATLYILSGYRGLDTGFFVLLAIVNLIPGIALLRELRWSVWASFTNLVLQIPTIASASFTYEYSGLGNAGVFAYIDPSTDTYLFGPMIEFSPTFTLSFGLPPQPITIGLDLLAAALALVVLRSVRRHRLDHYGQAMTVKDGQ